MNVMVMSEENKCWRCNIEIQYGKICTECSKDYKKGNVTYDDIILRKQSKKKGQTRLNS